VRRLEEALETQKAKMAEIEKMAKRKGVMALFMEFGAPLALWYAACWAGMLFALYMMLELEIISWQQSLRPLLEGLGLGTYLDRIDPTVGNLVIAITVNELLEPLRFPLVLATGKPVIQLGKKLRARLRPGPG